MRPVSTPDSVLWHPLSSLLGTEVSVRVMRELMLHGGELSAPQLALRASVSPPQVRSVLDNIVAAGIAEVLGSGRTRLFRANVRHPLSGPLGLLFRQEAARADEIRATLRRAIGSMGTLIIAAWLYGSVARREDSFGSDLDIAVVAEQADLEAVVDALREQLRPEGQRLWFQPAVVGLTPGDVARLERTKDPWWVTASRDAVVLAGAKPGEVVHRASTKQFAA